jgi:hypothetical protein
MTKTDNCLLLPFPLHFGASNSNVNLLMFDSQHDKSSNLDDCCHHIEKVSTSIQMFSIFIISLIITN